MKYEACNLLFVFLRQCIVVSCDIFYIPMLRATTISLQQPRRMASIFAKIQDKGTSLLFGKDGGTGKSILQKIPPISLFYLTLHAYVCWWRDVHTVCGVCANIAVWSFFVTWCTGLPHNKIICVMLRLFITHQYLSLLFAPTHHSSLQDKSNFYDLTDRDMDGNEVKMNKFKGDVLCLVNVASKWGLTKTNYGM